MRSFFSGRLLIIFLICARKNYLQGLKAIHDSAVGTHGHFKSSNCLVDNRWMVKVSDFGLHFLRVGGVQEPKGECHSPYVMTP